MNTTSTRTIATRRIATVLAGPAVIAGVLGGALALGAPAYASPPMQQTSCTTAKVAATPASITSLLTRPGQIDAAAAAGQRPNPAVSCIEIH